MRKSFLSLFLVNMEYDICYNNNTIAIIVTKVIDLFKK